jgi:hypothetical protein
MFFSDERMLSGDERNIRLSIYIRYENNLKIVVKIFGNVKYLFYICPVLMFNQNLKR